MWCSLFEPLHRKRKEEGAEATAAASELLSERGGPPVRPPERRGFGSRIVETALPNELGGEVAVDYRAEGLRCSIRSPLAALDKVDAFMPLG